MNARGIRGTAIGPHLIASIRSDLSTPAARALEPRLEWLAGYEFIVVAYVGVALVLGSMYGFELDLGLLFDLLLDSTLLGLIWLGLVLVLLWTGWRARRTEADRTAFGPAWRRRMGEEHLTRQRGYDLLKTLVLVKLVLLTYGTIKLAIPRIHPGLFDEELLRADRWLHGGLDPGQLSAGALGDPQLTRAIDVLYVGWYFVKVCTLVVFVLVTDRRLHAQFFGAYYALWIFGGLAAVLLPSLGPAYVRPETFAALNRPYASSLQEHLASHYPYVESQAASCHLLIYEGLAAFPSLHVAAAALFALFLARVSRPLAILMALYTVSTQIGAVHLGWHYALDGYAGTLVAVALYLLFTRGLHRENRSGPRFFPGHPARTSARAGWPPVAAPGSRTGP